MSYAKEREYLLKMIKEIRNLRRYEEKFGVWIANDEAIGNLQQLAEEVIEYKISRGSDENFFQALRR